MPNLGHIKWKYTCDTADLPYMLWRGNVVRDVGDLLNEIDRLRESLATIALSTDETVIQSLVDDALEGV